MSDPTSLDGFIGKWRARWPEWRVLSAFVPAQHRTCAEAWLSLLHEVHEAAWGGSDSTPGLAKLAWWQEELRGWSKGARRHPLGEALQKLEAPWDTLGVALAALPATRAPGADGDDTMALTAFATAVLACEATLFDVRDAASVDIESAIDGLRGERALVQGDAGTAARLGTAVAPSGGLSRVRRLHHVVLRERLRGPAAGRPPRRVRAFALLWAGWRAARAG